MVDFFGRTDCRGLAKNHVIIVTIVIFKHAEASEDEEGKFRRYCETDDNTDYCSHTAFAAALPQVRKAVRR